MLKPLVLLLTIASMSVATAATLSIGLVQSNGSFLADGSKIVGNGTLFEGTLIETSFARSMLSLPNAQMTLAPESRAQVFHDHIVLERGSILLKESTDHTVVAKMLHVAPLSRDSVVQVDITGPAQISVASRRGAAEILNSSGVLVASLQPGRALVMNAQPEATTVTLSGQVISKDGHYFLTDTTTNVTVQLEGAKVAKYAGKQVVIQGTVVTGSQAAAGASQLIQVVSIESLSAGGASSAAAGGLSGAAKAAIIGGVSAAGAVVGMAAAGTFTTTTPVSR